MIYTVGWRSIYRAHYQALKGTAVPFQKVGRRADYPGGISFRTVEDAQRFLRTPADMELVGLTGNPEGFEVWAIDADWDLDTAPSAHGWWHGLLRDADLLPLEDVLPQSPINPKA